MEPISVAKQRTDALVNDFVRSVYNWMCIGLALTGFIAWFVSGNDTIKQLVFGNRLVLIVLIIAELGLVFSISGMINKMSAGTATGLFVLYSAFHLVFLLFVLLVSQELFYVNPMILYLFLTLL